MCSPSRHECTRRSVRPHIPIETRTLVLHGGNRRKRNGAVLKLRADVAQWIEGLNPGGQAEATTIVPAKTLLDGIPRPDLAMVSRFFHSFASAESAVLRAVVSLVTPLARVRR